MYHLLPLIGIKGRIQTRDIEIEYETYKKICRSNSRKSYVFI